MNISTVADNLRNTIAGKEEMLEKLNKGRMYMTMAESLAGDATIEFLEINIAELQRILGDVEQCEQFNNYEKWDGDE